MKRTILLCAVTAVILTECGKAENNSLPVENVVCRKENVYSCTFDGTKHDFIVDMPEKSENAPLVLMLHGYGNTAESFRKSTHFEQDANPLGYAVVYVTGASDPTDRTSLKCWNSTEFPDSNKDTEFLASLSEYLCNEYSLDSSRTYAVGFSNGAFMVHTLAMKKSSVFSGFVSVAGMMQDNIWDNRSESISVNFFQITGEKDTVVPKNSDNTAKYSKAPPIEEVLEYFRGSAELSEQLSIGKESLLTKYKNKQTNRQVWDLFVKNGSHSWYAEQYNGFDINKVILEFFESIK